MKKIIPFLIIVAVLACEDPHQDLESYETIVEELDAENTIHKDEIFLVVEQQAQFPGGQEAYASFLDENLRYPNLARQMGIEGRVFASFIVSKEGRLSDVQLIRGIGGGCDKEVLRLLNSSPDWIPASQRGQNVHSRMQVAINFKLDNSEEIEVPVTEVHEKLIELQRKGKIKPETELKEVIELLEEKN